MKEQNKNEVQTKKVKTFSIRISDEERALFRSAAEREALTLTGWIRQLLTKEARKSEAKESEEEF